MRIVMLAQFYPPILGGIEQHVHTLSRELVARGHDVAVATLWHPGLPEFEVEQGVRVHRIRSSMRRIPGLFSDQRKLYAPPFPDPETSVALYRVLKKEQPELVHAHNWLVRSFLPLKSWSKARLVVTLHDYNLACARVDLVYEGVSCSGPGLVKCLRCCAHHYGNVQGPPTVLSNWLLDPAELGAVDMFVAVSRAVAAGNHLKPGRTHFCVIPNFIADQPDRSGDARSYLEQLPGDPYLLFVGGLGRMKGVDVLLRAYAELQDAPPLVLIGYDTPEWPQFASACPENVFVFKNWPHYAVMAAWEHCAFGLVPSISQDPCPTVAMEAMSMGKPLIASEMGGLIDMVRDGETGLLVPPDNPQALRKAIQQLLADPEWQVSMGEKARQRVLAFQAKSVVPRIEQVYYDVLHTASLPLPVPV